MRLVTSKNRAIQKILGNAFRILYFGALWTSLNKEDCNFIKQCQTQLSSMTHCLQSSLRKRYPWRPRISIIKGKAWFCDRVLLLKLIRNVVHKIYLYKKQDHLVNGNKMRRATGNPEATLLTTEYLVYESQRWSCRMHCECSKKHQHKEQFLKDMSQKEINKFSEQS